ncbi:MAG: hypothetical protein BMS9Abin01_0361 [Gammaproteobacteria bacterium]|nr:MAG: hypothetical protein BMS9Abin01_0361 [Gammaproteobacteria bacterium]
MTDTDPGPDDSLARQRLRLESLESCEDRMRILREQECALDVEHIAAEAALRSATRRLQPDIDPALASRIGHFLENRRELEERRRHANEDDGIGPAGSSRRIDRLRTGHAALQAWLDASRPREPSAVARAAMVALLIAVIVIVWAAFAIHLAFLLLLVVVVGPVSFVMGRGEDVEWRRVGARRRFETSGLADIAAWDENTVRARAIELEALLEAPDRNSTTGGAAVPRADQVDAQAIAAKTAEEDVQIASDLRSAGLTLEDAQGELGDWLRLVARADQTRESLQRVKNERTRVREKAVELRDHLLRYLQSRGVKPLQQQDSAAAIAESLDRLPRSS